MQGYSDPSSSRNTMRAAGGSANDGLTGSSEIPGKVNEPEGKDTGLAGTTGKSGPSAGSGVAGFSGSGVINPFVSGATIGGNDTADADDRPSV